MTQVVSRRERIRRHLSSRHLVEPAPGSTAQSDGGYGTGSSHGAVGRARISAEEGIRGASQRDPRRTFERGIQRPAGSRDDRLTVEPASGRATTVFGTAARSKSARQVTPGTNAAVEVAAFARSLPTPAAE